MEIISRNASIEMSWAPGMPIISANQDISTETKEKNNAIFLKIYGCYYIFHIGRVGEYYGFMSK